jgi:hypothetical protein
LQAASVAGDISVAGTDVVSNLLLLPPCLVFRVSCAAVAADEWENNMTLVQVRLLLLLLHCRIQPPGCMHLVQCGSQLHIAR